VSVDDIIARRKLTSTSRKRKRLAIGEDETSASENEGSGASSSGSDEDEEDLNEAPEGEDSEEEADPLATSGEDDSDVDEEPLNDDEAEATEGDESSSDESEPETQAQKDRKAAFFDSASSATETPSSFVSMNLSRPILKALTSLGFHTPTPIQSATIPVALLGKDVVGNAVTGSGKTAAFIIPMLERLLYREKGKKAAATRCLVLVPTRELGVQCFEVGKKLAAHTDVQFCLTVGPSDTQLILIISADFVQVVFL
jgi:ATP-dependent RNA helicase DDX27